MEDDVFEGTLSSKIVSKLFFMQCHMECTSEFLCVAKKRELKFFASNFIFVTSALFHWRIVLRCGFWCLAVSLLSIRAAWWSLTPGTTEDLEMAPRLLVKNRSRILSSLVGSFTTCSTPRSKANVVKSSLIEREY